MTQANRDVGIRADPDHEQLAELREGEAPHPAARGVGDLPLAAVHAALRRAVAYLPQANISPKHVPRVREVPIAHRRAGQQRNPALRS